MITISSSSVPLGMFAGKCVLITCKFAYFLGYKCQRSSNGDGFISSLRHIICTGRKRLGNCMEEILHIIGMILRRHRGSITSGWKEEESCTSE